MLTGVKVFLRPLQITDMGKTLEWRNDFFLKESTMSHPYPVTYQKEKEWYDNTLIGDNKERVYFAVCEIGSGEMIGYTFLHQIDWVNRNCFRGTVIGDKNSRGKGYGSEAIFLISKYAFENLHMHKIYTHVLTSHPATKTWLDLGAVIEGTLKNHFWNGNKYHDVYIMAWYPRYIEQAYPSNKECQ